jgi:hypothetical protein
VNEYNPAIAPRAVVLWQDPMQTFLDSLALAKEKQIA